MEKLRFIFARRRRAHAPPPTWRSHPIRVPLDLRLAEMPTEIREPIPATPDDGRPARAPREPWEM